MKHAFPKLKALHAVFGLDCPYTDAERGVAAVLILDRNDGNGCAYRGQEGIARRAGLSRRSTQRALESLLTRTDGPLLVRCRAQGRSVGAGGRAPNHYEVELRANLAHKGAEVTRQAGAQPARDLCAKSDGVVRQNEGGLCATVAQDLSSDLSIDRSSTSASPRSAVGFALVSPDQKVERPKRKPGPSKAKPEPKWAGVHPQAVAAYVEAFKQARGVAPFFGGAEAKAVSKLLDAVAGDLERFREVVGNGLANWHSAMILSIAADPSKAVTRRPANGHRGPVQQTGVDPFAGVQVIR